MTTTILENIANGLGKLKNVLAQTQYDLWMLKRNIENRERALQPADGWPGKNAEQRADAKTAAISSDPVLKQLTVDLESKTKAEYEYKAAVESLEDERRAQEWNIRAQLVAALAGKANSSHGSVEETAFDDVATEAATDRLFAKADMQAEVRQDVIIPGGGQMVLPGAALNLPKDDIDF